VTHVHPSESSAGREQRFVFDEVAELYARARPTYPAALVDDIIRESGLQPGGRILELGSGPGNGSVLFSGRGYHLLSLEPGARLAEVARRRLAEDNNAKVLVTTFEAWPIERDAFDLVFAAQSFHWMDPALRFSKTAQALKPHGTLAVFANRPLLGTSPADALIRQAYAAHAPAIDTRWIGHNTRDHFLELFDAAPEFLPAGWREYAWRAEYTSTEYLNLLQTQSAHRLLPTGQLTILLDAIGEAIDTNGGRLAVEYVAVLCWAHRAPV
jgi:SAM-dependent methyltransferase